MPAPGMPQHGMLPLGAARHTSYPPPRPVRRRIIHQPPPQRSRPGGRFLALVVTLAIFVTVGWAWNTVGTAPTLTSNVLSRVGEVGVNPDTPVWGELTLLVGTDSRTDAQGNPLSKAELRALSASKTEGGVATDSILVVHTPPDGGNATVISLPRDTWIDDEIVHAPGVEGAYSDGTTGPYKPNKLNSFYGSAKQYELEYLNSEGVADPAELARLSNEAGRAMLVAVVQQLIGVQIDHYAEISMLGFYLLSKEIGGVAVCLLDPVKDHHSGADFPAGHFEVSGASALAFVRQRHGLPRGDLDRIARQRAFLVGVQQKLFSPSLMTSPNKIQKIVGAADRGLVLDDDSSLLSFGQQLIKVSGATTALPTQGEMPGIGTSALAVEPAEVRQFFADIVAPPADNAVTVPIDFDVAPASITVDIQNGTVKSGMAAALGRKVSGAGYQRGQLSDYPGTTDSTQQSETTVHYPSGAQAAAKQIVETIGMGDVVADDDIAAGHILVIIGTDMPRDLAEAVAYTTLSLTTKNAAPDIPKVDVGKAGNTGCIH